MKSMKFFREDGQSLVELALVLPLLLIMLLGTVELGRVFHAYIVVTQASREAARSAAIGMTDVEIETVVKDNTSSLGNNVMINITPLESERKIGSNVKVEVDYAVDLIAPFAAVILTDPFPVRGSTSMRME